MALGSTSGSGISVPDPHTIGDLLADLEHGARRCQQLTTTERMHHPSTMPELIVAVDDIADTVARLRDLLP